MSGAETTARGASTSGVFRDWEIFKERFVSGGRVIDTGNGGVSHSEGQGVGLLSAAMLGDRVGFNEMYEWTRETLRRGGDHLHSWRYRPGVANPVDDPNNATDGDLLIAFATFIAGDRWADQGLQRDAFALATDIGTALTTQTARGTFLLPGVDGFRDRDGLTINPSYYVFPALAEFARQTRDPLWNKVHADGVSLLREARFGRWQLPPDWLSVPRIGDIVPASKWPARFSFDAVRVPLYMCWAGLGDEPAVTAARHFWAQSKTPAWTDLNSGEVAPYALTPGMLAIKRLAETAGPSMDETPLPSVETAQDYYSGALIMLSALAQADRGSRLS